MFTTKTRPQRKCHQVQLKPECSICQSFIRLNHLQSLNKLYLLLTVVYIFALVNIEHFAPSHSFPLALESRIWLLCKIHYYFSLLMGVTFSHIQKLPFFQGSLHASGVRLGSAILPGNTEGVVDASDGECFEAL